MKLTAKEKTIFLRLMKLVNEPGVSAEEIKYHLAEMAVHIYPRVAPDHGHALNVMLKIDNASTQLFDQIASGRFEVRELGEDLFEVKASESTCHFEDRLHQGERFFTL